MPFTVRGFWCDSWKIVGFQLGGEIAVINSGGILVSARERLQLAPLREMSVQSHIPVTFLIFYPASLSSLFLGQPFLGLDLGSANTPAEPMAKAWVSDTPSPVKKILSPEHRTEEVCCPGPPHS